MFAIGPGDWVEFIGIDDGAAPFPGRIYRISRLQAGSICETCGDDGDGVELEGIPPSEWSFCVGCEVRPIYRPKQEIIEALKAPPKRVKEDA